MVGWVIGGIPHGSPDGFSPVATLENDQEGACVSLFGM